MTQLPLLLANEQFSVKQAVEILIGFLLRVTDFVYSHVALLQDQFPPKHT